MACFRVGRIARVCFVPAGVGCPTVKHASGCCATAGSTTPRETIAAKVVVLIFVELRVSSESDRQRQLRVRGAPDSAENIAQIYAWQLTHYRHQPFYFGPIRTAGGESAINSAL